MTTGLEEKVEGQKISRTKIKSDLIVRKCYTCLHYKEIAGGPDHGDIRCTQPQSPAYHRWVTQSSGNAWEEAEKCTFRRSEKGRKVVVITGASRGIGKAFAQQLALDYDLALLSHNQTELETVIRELPPVNGGFFLPLECDLQNKESIINTFNEIYRQFGSIDVLINNAGVNSRRTLNPQDEGQWFEELDKNLQGWDREIAVNLTGAYLCSYLAAGYMLKHHSGSIINISSIKGIEPTVSPGYGASKAGIIKLTKDFAKALAPHGIRVNCIAPGFINTGMTTELSEEKRESYLKLIPQGRFGEGIEMAKVAAFLASPDSSYITGAVLNVNGGYLM